MAHLTGSYQDAIKLYLSSPKQTQAEILELTLGDIL